MNTKFVNKNFEYAGGYLTYAGPFDGQKTYEERIFSDVQRISSMPGANKIHPSRIGKKKEAFIARFKNGGVVAFKKFLRDNFTVEEYLGLMDSGLAPLKVLETKGYVSPNVCNVLKHHGYPMTVAGRDAYIKDGIAGRRRFHKNSVGIAVIR
jgi:hypothetical protein